MQKKKKAIILLITLLFISAISVLILQNLKQTDKFFNVINTNMALTQTQILIKNTNDEVIKYIKKYEKEDIVSKLPIVLPLELTNNINILININVFDSDNLIFLDDLKSDNLPNNFTQNVDYKYMFFKILSKYKTTTNDEQVDYIIQEYIKQTNDNRILNIKDSFYYGSYSTYKDKLFLQCDYTIDVDGIKSKVNMIYKYKDNKPTHFKFYLVNSDV